jgi:hypothetical protein
MTNILKSNWILILMIAVSAAFASCDQCQGINCQNEGSCEKGECECPSGFSGDRCEFEDKCLTGSLDCKNGGICKDGACDCAEGFSGKECKDEDLCITNGIECENGGKCEDGECDCPPNYSGSRCQYYTNPDPCANVTCYNNEPCVDGSCACSEWTSGSSCERIVIDKYVDGMTYTGSWYNSTTFDYLSAGSIKFVVNTSEVDQLDLDYEIVGQQLELELFYTDTTAFDIPSQSSGTFTLAGYGYLDGSRWFIEINDGSASYFFDQD